VQKIKIKAKVEGVVPDVLFLKSLVDQLRDKKSPEEKEDLVFIWQLVNQYRERMINQRTHGHIKNFKSLADGFKNYFPMLTFSELSPEWMQAWTDWLIDDQELLTNTIVRKIRELRSVARWSMKIGVKVNPHYDEFRIKERRYHPFYLDWDIQLKKIEEVEIEDKTLGEIRDRFIFRCYTGMREGELNQLLPQHFTTKAGKYYLKYEDIKGKKPKSIQLSEKAVALAQKYSFALPKYAQQTENDLIKEVGRMAKLTQIYVKTRHSGSRVIVKHITVADMISTHTARRTFARRWYDQGGSVKKLSQYLGHSSMRITELYIGVEDDEANDEMMRVMG